MKRVIHSFSDVIFRFLPLLRLHGSGLTTTTIYFDNNLKKSTEKRRRRREESLVFCFVCICCLSNFGTYFSFPRTQHKKFFSCLRLRRVYVIKINNEREREGVCLRGRGFRKLYAAIFSTMACDCL